MTYIKIGQDFLNHLKAVFSRGDIDKCIEDVENLKANGISNLVKSEIEMLLQQHEILQKIKTSLDNQSEKMKRCVDAMNSCLKRYEDFANLRDNMNKQFTALSNKIDGFTLVIREDIKDLKTSIMEAIEKAITKNLPEEHKHVNFLKDRNPNFTARTKEIDQILEYVNDDAIALVCIHGGPGFGKSSLAVEVAHRLEDNHDKDKALVIFSETKHAASVDEVILQLCRDVNVNIEQDDDFTQSLTKVLRNDRRKVFLIIDDIDGILNENEQSKWNDFIMLVRKNTNQTCQFITTSRTKYVVPDATTREVSVDEMDEESSLELLKKHCAEEDEMFLKTLATLCGHIPLALCIAASRVRDFPDRNIMLECLKDDLTETLTDIEGDRRVNKAIQLSYDRLTEEEQKFFVRISVLKGSFSADSAKTILQEDHLKTTNLLKTLHTHSLLTRSNEGRYSLHHLIRHFLSKHGDQIEIKEARNLMVEHYLKFCHDATIQSYSKDGFVAARNRLKLEASNIENILSICCDKNDKNTQISDVLIRSEIFDSSCRFFYNTTTNGILSEELLINFIQNCSDLAKERQQWSKKIDFDCILVDHEGRVSFWQSDAYFDKIKMIAQEYDNHEDEFRDKPVFNAHFKYQLGRYFLNRSRNSNETRSWKLDNIIEAIDRLKDSCDLRKQTMIEDSSPLSQVDVILSLLVLGKLTKQLGLMQNNRTDRENRDKCNAKAESCFKEALSLAEENLGKHELTISCYKALGDLLLTKHENEEASENYIVALDLFDELGITTNQRQIFLLHSYGLSLMYMDAYEESEEILLKALSLNENYKLGLEQKIEQTLKTLEDWQYEFEE